MNWYALHVRSQCEGVVAQKLQGAGIEAYYPHLIQRSRDKKRDIEKKFFPGYCFARFDLFEQRAAVIGVPQVVSILGWGPHAIAIPDYEIEAVRIMVATPAALPVFEVPYVSAGDRVRVLHGPLQGLEGFVAYEKNKTRVVVSVTGLGRSISAEVDAYSLAVLDRAAAPIAA